MGYGQHQSFYLRDRWLNKSIIHLGENNRFFYEKDAFEKIGLGKNMLQSLRYWVVATGVVEEIFNDDRKKIHQITSLGELIFKFDPYIKKIDTAMILHYQMVKQKEPSTAWYWYFNILNETVITKEELLASFIKWVDENETKPVSEKSLKRDIDCLVKLYNAGQNVSDPEEIIQSPLNKLGLVKEKRGMIIREAKEAHEVGLSALMYVLLDYRKMYSVETVSVDELVHNVGLWGRTFNLGRSSIVSLLNKLTMHTQYPIKFIRTNNLDLIRIPEVDPLQFIHDEMQKKSRV